MIPKRVKQFYINLTDRYTKEDEKYVKSILDDFEYNLFKDLSNSEKKHSVRVSNEFKKISEEINLNKLNTTKDLLSEESEPIEKIKEIISQKGEQIIKDCILENREMFIKAGLLHDIGKSVKRINIIDKSIIVILNKLTSGNLKKLKNKKVQCYYKHSEYSEDMLKGYIKDVKMLNLIKKHHCDTDNLEILLFQIIDDRN